MKKNSSRLLIILAASFWAAGCVPLYKFQKDERPYQGYVVKRNEYLIPEFTTDTEKKAPESLEAAKQRLKRRKATVVRYYRKMELIAPPDFVTFPKLFGNTFLFIFRWPFVITHEIRYSRSPAYRQRQDARAEHKYQKELAQKRQLQEELNQYIRQDVENEGRASVLRSGVK